VRTLLIASGRGAGGQLFIERPPVRVRLRSLTRNQQVELGET
jgi:hypothetical protein